MRLLKSVFIDLCNLKFSYIHSLLLGCILPQNTNGMKRGSDTPYS